MLTADPEIAAAAGVVLDGNRAAGRTVAVAESCTGGMVCAALTDLPGSSDVVHSGFVTYSNAAKQQALGVDADLIETYGAVSLACAWAMARGALAASGADVAVAITGVAGPGGGTERKPVGLVIFARAERGGDGENVAAQRVFFQSTDRAAIRRAATLFALRLLQPDGAMIGLDPGADMELAAP